MRLKNIYISLIYIYVTFSCLSQYGSVKKLGFQDGLLTGKNYYTINDLTGGIWVCSEGGITKFQNNSHVNFTYENGLKNNDVWGLTCDSKNRIWITSFINGVQYIENNKIYTVKNSEKFSNLRFSGESGDTVYFSNYINGGFINRYFISNTNSLKEDKARVRDSFSIIADFPKYGFKVLRNIKENTDNYYLYSVQKKTIVEYKFPLETKFKKTIINNSEYLFTPKYHEKSSVYFHLSKNNFQKIVSIYSDPILFGGNYMYFYLKGKHQILRRDNGARVTSLEELFNDSAIKSPFQSIVIDELNNFWVTTIDGELYFMSLSKKINFTFPYLETNKSFNLPKYFNKNIRLESDLLTLNQIKNNKLKKEILTFNFPIRYLAYNNNYLLVNSNRTTVFPYGINADGFMEIDSKHPKDLDILKFDLISVFVNDSIVLSDRGYLLNLFDNSNTPAKRLSNFPKLERVTSMCRVDSKIVIMNSDRICIYDLNKKSNLFLNVSNPRSFVFYNGLLYVNSSEEGLVIYNIDNVKPIKKFPSLKGVRDFTITNNEIYIAEKFKLYKGELTNNNGIHIVEVIAEICPGDNYFNRFKQFGKEILIEGNHKIFKLDQSKSINSQVSKFQIFIKNNQIIFQNGKTKTKIFNENENDLTVKLRHPSFFSSKNIVYRYRLLPDQKNWIYTKNSILEFENLAPGDYQLIIESAIHELGTFGSTKSVKLQFLPPFIRTKLFYFIVALIVLIFGYLIYYISTQIIKKRTERELTMKKLEINSLQSQLNPHFIFNSLNSIQSMVFSGKERLVNDFIGSFATLIRKVLDSSRLEKITLADEIDLLRSYLNLEKHRFGEEFYWDIVVDLKQDIKDIYIPGMLIQPFVENSVIHAFKGITKNKILTINFYSENQYLICEIKDNGIGFDMNQSVKKDKKGKSWGTKIVYEKIAILKELNHEDVIINTTSSQTNDSNRGTKVLIRIRLTENNNYEK